MTTCTDYDAIYDRLEFVPHRCPERMMREIADGLDPAIREAVLILNWYGINTCQSCQGGPDHAYPEPTVDFIGNAVAGMHALAAAVMYGLPVTELRQKWRIENGMPAEEVWQLIFKASIRDGVDDPIAHASPMPDEELTPCCGVAPWDLPKTERMTNDVAFVTCRGGGV